VVHGDGDVAEDVAGVEVGAYVHLEVGVVMAQIWGRREEERRVRRG
jgi:hypothetical protein